MATDHLAHLNSESARFGQALRSADPSARVPTCPDWTAADLLWHLAGSVYPWWETIVRTRMPVDASFGDVDLPDPDRPDSYADLLALYERSRTALLATLESAGPDDTPVWTWSNDHTVGFARRRMAQETLVHRVDAEATTGEVGPIDTDLAVDGIAESLEHFLGGIPPWATWSPDGPVGLLRASDTGDEWTVRIGSASGTDPRGRTYTDEPVLELVADGADPSFTVSGSARDLELWLWNRPVQAAPAVDGSADDFARLQRVVGSGVDSGVD